LRISEILSRRGPILNAFSWTFERFTSKGLTDKSRQFAKDDAMLIDPRLDSGSCRLRQRTTPALLDGKTMVIVGIAEALEFLKTYRTSLGFFDLAIAAPQN